MRVLVNAASASLGGAATYLRELLAEHRDSPGDLRLTVLVPASKRDALGPETDALELRPVTPRGGALGRLWLDQVTQGKLIARERIDAVFSSANLGMLRAPVPQLLLVRNALFFSALYRDTLLPRKRLRHRQGEGVRRWLAQRSIAAADIVMVPSEAMRADLVAAHPGATGRIAVNHYGVRPERFALTTPSEVGPREKPRIVFTSLYSEHKNLGTLFTAIELLHARGRERVLRTPADPRLEGIDNPIRAREARQADALRALGLVETTGLLGPEALARLYDGAAAFVYPSVVESFGHPLLEAMAAGVPVVAADVPINREVCGDAAVYFPPFDPSACADAIERVLAEPRLRSQLTGAGADRVRGFTWRMHLERLRGLLKRLVPGPP